jgi:hypothetical protein
MIPIAQGIKARIGEWDCFCKSKEIIIRVKRQPTEWEKVFVRYSSNRALIS